MSIVRQKKDERLPVMSLQLLDGGALSRTQDLSPVGIYIASLDSDESKRTMLDALRRAALMIGAESLDTVRWERLRYAHVEVLKERMTKAQRAGRKPLYQPATINTTLSAVRGVARQAWLLRIPDDSNEQKPAMTADDYQRIAAVKGVRAKRDRSGRALSAEELARLLDICQADTSPAGARDACLIALLAGGGLRRMESVSLNLSSYQPLTHQLKITGKGDKERTIYFEDGGTRRALRDWLRVRGLSPGALLLPVSKTGVIGDGRLHPSSVFKILERRARQARIRRVSPHDCRRTFVTELLNQGADISAVQALVGHASVETTVLYDRRGEDAKKRAMRLTIFPSKHQRKRNPRRSRASKRRRRGRDY
jgi:integrase/recombinase XerD